MGAVAGLRAVLIGAENNSQMKELKTVNIVLIFAYENGYAFGRIIANQITSGGELTEAEAMQKLNAHCREMFCTRYPEEFWTK